MIFLFLYTIYILSTLNYTGKFSVYEEKHQGFISIFAKLLGAEYILFLFRKFKHVVSFSGKKNFLFLVSLIKFCLRCDCNRGCVHM